MNNINLKLLLSSAWGNIKKIPWVLGKRAFLVILFLIILDLVFGMLVLYNYIFLIETSRPRITESPSTFKNDIYQEILKHWEIRDQKLQDGKVQNTF